MNRNLKAVLTSLIFGNRIKKIRLIFELSKYFHALPATSTPSERLFSRVGYQVWDRRNKISSEKVVQVMFLYEHE